MKSLPKLLSDVESALGRVLESLGSRRRDPVPSAHMAGQPEGRPDSWSVTHKRAPRARRRSRDEGPDTRKSGEGRTASSASPTAPTRPGSRSSPSRERRARRGGGPRTDPAGLPQAPPPRTVEDESRAGAVGDSMQRNRARLPVVGRRLTWLIGLGALLALAWHAGRQSALGNLPRQVRSMQRMETLGGVARHHDERLARAESARGGTLARVDRYTWQVAQAYDDPERALAELDGYTWQVRTVPVPFAGAAPAPGDHPGVRINSQHFRHPEPLAIPKPDGVFRVFVTGGSTAFGSGAPSDRETITGFLQELVDRELAPVTGERYEIVNAANAAWASTHERILITNRLSEFEPDLVVSFSGNNDAHFGYLGLHSLWFHTYAEQFHASVLSATLERIGSAPFPSDSIWSPRIDAPVAPEEVTRRLVKNLRLASTALEETGAPYLFVLQPTLATTGKALSERELMHRDAEYLGSGSASYFRRCYRLYRERLSRLELPGFRFIDASRSLDGHGEDQEIFLDSYHFGDRGNRLLAEFLFEVLRPHLVAGRGPECSGVGRAD